MPTFLGFSTIDRYKKFDLQDFELIKRDLLNALNIRQGEKVGRPQVGTSIWTLIYDPQTQETAKKAHEEIQRIIAQDPRIQATDIQVYPQDSGLLIEVEINVIGSTTAERLNLFFDQNNNRATYL